MLNDVVKLLLLAWTLQAAFNGVSGLPKITFADLFNLKNAKEETTSCGYSNCPPTDASKLNVHIVAHTHDDVGWLKTVDEYYYGTRKQFSQVGVQHILDSVIPQLMMDKSKRFIYVEMSFFAKWWEEQDEQMQSIVKRLVNEGRLEFINGGWCMNDEATVNYQSTIEQMTLGLKFLNETFGTCGHPKVGWQIDPFGHTNEQASLFAQFGFDGMFFTRISFEDKIQRTLNKSLDLIWHGDRILSGESGSIFTNIFRDGYDSPNGFCFDVMCLDDNLVDNRNSYEYNIESKGNQFIAFIRNYSDAKLTNHLLIPLGGDFQYSAAGQNFKNADKLLRYVKNHAPDINIFYSTPSCYQYAIYQTSREKSLSLPEKFDDFIPYDSSWTIWWSGYFTSRPSVKLIERETADLLQVTRLISFANLLKYTSPGSNNSRRWVGMAREHEVKCLQPLWEVLGDLQHHDAVTGTEKQHVSDDYVRRTSDAWTMCAKFIGDLRRMKLNEMLKKSGDRYEQLRESGKKYKLDSVFIDSTILCPYLNISQCDPIESEINMRRFWANLNSTNRPTQEGSQQMSNGREHQSRVSTSKSETIPAELITRSVLLNVYNPLARPISQHDIRLPCNGRCDLDKVQVIHLATNETMKLIRLPLPSGIITLPFRDARTTNEILFYANIPALGFTSFLIEDTNNEEIVDEELDPTDSIIISDQSEANKARNAIRSRRLREVGYVEELTEGEFLMDLNSQSNYEDDRIKRDSSLSQQSAADQVIVKFDMGTGMIVGLKRVNDGSFLNITQKFGYYYPANSGHQPGAYIFRPNTTEPILLNKPITYKMFKRKNGALIEIHQKWLDWIWQTIRVDAKKNYIEFDYVIGPIATGQPLPLGKEVVTRYITNMANNGVFLTDSNARQMMVRRRLKSEIPEQLGGSFYPVVSTIMLKNSANTSEKCTKCPAETVAVLVDRPQAGASLNEGQIELLIHRRHMKDDNFGVAEALNEPGEDGRGLVSRGKHRLYLKFEDASNANNDNQLKTRMKYKMFKLPQTPKSNLTYEEAFAKHKLTAHGNKEADKTNSFASAQPTYIVHDPVLNDLKQEYRKFALRPILTFDRLRVSASEFTEMIFSDGNAKVKTDLTLLNNTLPNNVHLLTLQPWSSSKNEILIRFENLDNPLTLHPHPNLNAYQNLVKFYGASSSQEEIQGDDICADKLRPRIEVDIEYLIKRIRIVSLDELNLGANIRLKDDVRLKWTGEDYDKNCESSDKATSIKLAPRQIRTFLARFEFL